MCSMERNRNGIASTFIDGTMFPSSATLVRLRSITPARVCSSVSFSSPSWREWNTLIWWRPLLRSETTRPMKRSA